MLEIKKRFIYSSPDNSFPLYVESIGSNPQEEDFARPEGYPYYHWIQTTEGEGVIIFNGNKHILTKGKGTLLLPFTPHSYFASEERWSTVYMTFSGAIIEDLMLSLAIHHSAIYSEPKGKSTLVKLVRKIMKNIESAANFSSLDASEYLYRFLLTIKRYSDSEKGDYYFDNYNKVQKLVTWLENNFADDIGLDQMAGYVGVSPQYLATLFKQALNLSPYAFLIQLRIREAKKKLLTHKDLPLREIANQVGFRDVSHFIATFKRIEGITPRQYVELFNQS